MNAKNSFSSRKQGPPGPRSWIELFKTARNLYQKGVDGDKGATKEAYGLLEQLRTKVPENNLILAYYGSTLCLLGRDQADSIERSANVIRGLKYIDQAVAREPENFEIRVIRGSLCVNLPEMYFHRNASAVEDCNYIISCYERYPDSIPAELYFQFLYNLSVAYCNLGKTELSDNVIQKLCHESKDPKYKELLAPKKAAEGYQFTESFFTMLQPLPVILEEGHRLHQAALTGGKTVIQKAINFFLKAQVFHPDNQLLKTLLADCMSLKGKTSSNTGEMFASAIKAIKAIDAAVVTDPDNVQLRLIRASHSFRLPELFFARTATAITDLEYLAERLKQEPGLLAKEQAEEILFNLGVCYFRLRLEDEGAKVWQDLSQTCGERIKEQITFHRHNNTPPDVNSNKYLVTNQKEFYSEAKRLHNLGVGGNKAAAQKGLDMWEKAHSEYPNDPVANGFYGSSLALVGREATEINTMFGNAIKGLKHINEAIGCEPDNPELRLLRAYLSYSLPEVFFHTTQQAIQDFQYLIKAYQQDNCLFTKEIYDRMLIDLQKAKELVE